ncbi:MAG: hypothetical protein BV459_03890, partial [Thermoplasmata archaeon M11B2D]
KKRVGNMSENKPSNKIVRELVNAVKNLTNETKKINDTNDKISQKLDTLGVQAINKLSEKLNNLVGTEILQEALMLVDLKTDIIFVATLVSEWFTSADMLAEHAKRTMEAMKTLSPGNERDSLKKKFIEQQAEANKFHLMGQEGSIVLEKILVNVASMENERYPSLGQIPRSIPEKTKEKETPRSPGVPPVPGVPKYTKDNPPPRMSKMEDQKD